MKLAAFPAPVGSVPATVLVPPLKAIVDEANRHGVKVAAHAHGNAGIKAAVRARLLNKRDLENQMILEKRSRLRSVCR